MRCWCCGQVRRGIWRPGLVPCRQRVRRQTWSCSRISTSLARSAHMTTTFSPSRLSKTSAPIPSSRASPDVRGCVPQNSFFFHQASPVSPPIPRIYVPVLSTAVAELQTHGLPTLLHSLQNPPTTVMISPFISHFGAEYPCRIAFLPSRPCEQNTLLTSLFPLSGPRQHDVAERRGIAYLYSRCDREDREALVTELRATHALPVLAMGACQGAGIEPVCMTSPRLCPACKAQNSCSGLISGQYLLTIT